MQNTTNLMVKHIADSHFLGFCRQDVLLRQAAISPRQPHASEARISKLNSTETNPVIFYIPENTFIGHAILHKHENIFFREKSLGIEGMGLQLAFAIHNHC